MITLTTIQATDYIAKPAHLTEVYATENGAVYQNNRSNRFVVEFAGTATNYKVQHFLNLKKMIDSIDLNSLAADTSRAGDFEIISVAGNERVYVLNLSEIIAFKELVSGAKVMLDLNSIIHQTLTPQAV